MNTTSTFLLLALAAGISFTGCKGTGTQKEISYNNYTGTDTEAFNFLKEGYHHANYQQFAATQMSNTGLAADISKTYEEVTQKLIELGTYNNVLIPPLNEVPFEKSSSIPKKDTVSVVENSVIDSLSTVEVSVDPQTDNSIEKIIASQEKLIYQFKNASENTNVSIRDYAQETLPRLEELLDKTKTAAK